MSLSWEIKGQNLHITDSGLGISSKRYQGIKKVRHKSKEYTEDISENFKLNRKMSYRKDTLVWIAFMRSFKMK